MHAAVRFCNKTLLFHELLQLSLRLGHIVQRMDLMAQQHCLPNPNICNLPMVIVPQVKPLQKRRGHIFVPPASDK